jgi:predicted nucleotidyltransferase
MSDKTILKSIKTTVKAFLPDARVLLFGSRARGDNNKDSDFDVLVITPQNLSDSKKKSLRIKIKQALLEILDVPVDILVNSEKEIAIKKELPGHTINWAMKEGVLI